MMKTQERRERVCHRRTRERGHVRAPGAHRPSAQCEQIWSAQSLLLVQLAPQPRGLKVHTPPWHWSQPLRTLQSLSLSHGEPHGSPGPHEPAAPGILTMHLLQPGLSHLSRRQASPTTALFATRESLLEGASRASRGPHVRAIVVAQLAAVGRADRIEQQNGSDERHQQHRSNHHLNHVESRINLKLATCATR